MRRRRELLERAHLTLTHAGLNTVLDSLAHGVPMVAVPITYEQPAIARRVEWHACGESISLAQLNVRRVCAPVWQACCRIVVIATVPARIKAAISAAGGVEKATVLIESAVKRYSCAAVRCAVPNKRPDFARKR